ncbi:hypothetical protein MASR2M39_29820 [Ignavibacteriales bacterium]
MESKELAKDQLKELSGKLGPNMTSKDEPHSSLDSRISSISLDGSFKIGDPWEDYEVLLSDNLFKNLYLDFKLCEKYSDETVLRHYTEISRFLNDLQKLKDGGISFTSSYPKLNIELAKRKLTEAKQRLNSSKDRKDYYQQCIEESKTQGKVHLVRLINTILADNRVTIDETNYYIKEAAEYYYSADEAATMLFEAVIKAGLKPVNPIGEGLPPLMRLLETDFALEEKGKPFQRAKPSKKGERLSVEDFIESGMIEEYLVSGGTQTGTRWLEFYKKINQDFRVDSLVELKTLVEKKQSTKTLKILTPETTIVTKEPDPIITDSVASEPKPFEPVAVKQTPSKTGNDSTKAPRDYYSEPKPFKPKKKESNFGIWALALVVIAIIIGIWVNSTSSVTPTLTSAQQKEMVLVEGGTFTMGATSEQGSEAQSYEKPAHKVTVGSFLIGKTELTVGQFKEFIVATGYKTSADVYGGSVLWYGGDDVKKRRSVLEL